ncbi:SAGA HAT/Core module component [Mortierella polycephala]|uniref:SAGA HAT/Core module component n=1 Tax=Mortierella polycephala TaxID=41804 RepID=A0A9P6Q126_9FUNG|nr:SAGA HAT/Core module component [Mortierella polycephala]
MQDRRNYRAGTAIGTGGAPIALRLTMEDTHDEAVVWKSIMSGLTRLSEIRDESDHAIMALDKIPEGRSNRSTTLCQDATEKAREETEVIQRTLEGIGILLAIRDGDLTAADNSPEGKRKKRKIEAEGLVSNSKKIRRYSSTDPNGVIPVGHQVAARTPKDKNKQEEWILARVLSYSAEKNKLRSNRWIYVVEDDEADDYGKKMTYSLSARSVIMIADDQDSVPEFPAGHTVLALYPSTTCFYKAIVVQPPSKNKDNASPVYRIKFDDDEGNERTAPPRMVLDMPKLK